MTDYVIFDVELKDRYGGSIMTSGGLAIVTLQGLYTNATLYNPDSNFAALSQPVSLTRGKLRFAVATSAGQPTPPIVDIYGVSPTGHGFQAYNCKPRNPGVIRIDTMLPHSVMVAPFSYASGVATEVDTGLDFLAGSLIDPYPWIDVDAIHSAKTLDVGLLSSESGGDADGLLAAVSVGTLGVVRGQFASTATAGALVRESQDSAAVNTPRPYVVSTAVSLTWTVSSGTTTAKGRIAIPFRVGPINA